jgi:wyosine [tRNA(Phe)-imidazoG37] synthetase (radical SAM superfamily)
MNPDMRCDFDCAYCEVNRSVKPAETVLDVNVMIAELERTISLVRSGKIRERPAYRAVDTDLLQLCHVAFSGDGEPTLCPRFGEVVQNVVHLRARGGNSFFKLVLITNCTGLDARPVQESLKYFTREDEIWAKLDAGTQAYMAKVNRSRVPLDKVLSNILLVARRRSVVIQSIFPLINGEEPPVEEIDAYLGRLNELKNAHAQISLVQIYSATRPSAHPENGHMPLKSLCRICQRIKSSTGLKAEVF